MPIELQKGVERSFASGKILPYPEAVKKASELKKEGKKVGLCHGGFDLMHPGHIRHFESAKSLCDSLFVSVTSDKFLAGRKGTGRPVIPEQLRAYSIACTVFVDYVFISDFEKAAQVIRDLKPDLYIKGSDFIGKATPGINAERKAILSAGGKMAYTKDPKLSTSEIVRYIKEDLDRVQVLLVLDRDGTIVDDAGFLGKNKGWKGEVKLNQPVIDLLSYAQTRYDATTIVVSNQSGVARKYFNRETVEQINGYIGSLLREKGIQIDDWQYCPDADAAYANSKEGETEFDPRFVKEHTERKPHTGMVYASLRKLHKSIGGFGKVVVIGDSGEDRTLAERLGASFIGVKGKTYEELTKELLAIAG